MAFDDFTKSIDQSGEFVFFVGRTSIQQRIQRTNGVGVLRT
jgi:hypothetical protein